MHKISANECTLTFLFDIDGVNEDQESFHEWQSRILSQLESVDSNEEIGSTDEDAESPDQVKITWKTFDEEAKELMHQLERLRMQEVNKVKARIVKLKKEHSQRLLKIEKQRHLLKAQIDAIETNVLPEIDTQFQSNSNSIRSAIADIEEFARHLEKEIELVTALRDNMSPNPFVSDTNIRLGKTKDLLEACESELRETRGAKADELHKLDQLKQKRDADIALNKEKVRILDENLKHLQQNKVELESEHQKALEEHGSQLERAERKSHFNNNSPNQDEHWFGCPVCLLLLKPPMRIFQCPEGHILCEECKENPAMVHCPQCR